MIVIVATSEDTAVQAVVEALERRGRKDVLWLDLEKAYDEVRLLSSIKDGAIRWSIQSRKRTELLVTEESVDAVYWRRPVSYLGSPFLGIPTSANLDAVEVFWSVRWHIESLPPKLFPLGHPWVFQRAENKHRQMEMALQLGFRVPETLHSNDVDRLRNFAAEHEQVALKALRMPAVTTTGEVQNARHIACKAFEGSFLAQKLEGVQRCQLYCQEVVQRKKDWRITVLPHTTIAVEIDTSKLEGNKLDWREHSYEVEQRVVTLDPALDAKLREYLARMELTAGYFDFAVPEEGEPVFFECNTNAQWLWMEKVTGYPFADMVAQELCIA